MMRKSKRSKLAAKGWKIGDTKSFLDLTGQESVYIELRLMLAEGLKVRRIER